MEPKYRPSRRPEQRLRPGAARATAGLLLVLALGAPPARAELTPPDSARSGSYTMRGYDTRIQHGIDLIYSLRLDEADRYFREVIASDPGNPLGHFFLAMVTWWRVLTDLESREHDEAFYRLLDKCVQVCDRRLADDPDDFDAVLFKAGAIGFGGRLRGNRGQYLRAAAAGLKSLPLLEQSRRMEPTNKDILFGQGIYNYFAEVIPREYPVVRPIMWLLPEGDREKGLQQLREVAREGRYARTEAAYFLARIHRMFEDDKSTALEFLEELHARYPENGLFHRYTARTLIDLGRWGRGGRLYREVVRHSREGRPGHHARGHMEALYHLGKRAFYQARLPEAARSFAAVDSLGRGLRPGSDLGYLALGNLMLGMTYDRLGERALAVECYERVMTLPNQDKSHKLAGRYLDEPYGVGPRP